MKKINKKTLTVSLAIIAAVCVIFGIVLLLASPKSGGSANIANGSFESLDSSGLIWQKILPQSVPAHLQ